MALISSCRRSQIICTRLETEAIRISKRVKMLTSVLFRNPGFSLKYVAVVVALLAVGCARKNSEQESAAAASAAAAKAAPPEATKESPTASLPERLAREKFTGDLDDM